MFYDVDGKSNGPAWVKLSIQKMIDFFEVETAEEVIDMVKDDPELLSEMGKVLFNLMLYGYDRNNDYLSFKYRDMRSLYGMLRQDIDSSYLNYQKLSEAGKKGGRPKKKTEDDTTQEEKKEVVGFADYPFSKKG